jgi:hypothetical protein
MRTELAPFRVSRTVFLCALSVAGTLAHAACSPAAAAPLPAPAGASAQGDTYEVALVPPAAAKPGAGATARVVVKAKGPYHVNRDYPMAFRPDAAASTVTFAGEKVPLGQGAERTACKDFPAESCAVSVPLAFTPKAAGEAKLVGVVAFSVCNPDRCLIEKVPVAASVLVK